MITILITGADGQLGSEFKSIAASSADFKFLFTDIGQLDISCEFALNEFFEVNRPDIVVNCAAYTAVDMAEKEIDHAYKVNADAPALLAKMVEKYHAWLFHISTDFVFDGTKNTPYTENDNAYPISVYGQSKRSGELKIIQNTSSFLILRTAWLYSIHGHNFVKTILNNAREKAELRVVQDQTGTPTYARNLAKTIIEIIEKGSYRNHNGIYHFSELGVATWFDFAVNIVDLAGISCRIYPILTQEYPTPAKRPSYSVLDKSKFIKDFGITIPYWRNSLQECINRLNSDKL